MLLNRKSHDIKKYSVNFCLELQRHLQFLGGHALKIHSWHGPVERDCGDLLLNKFPSLSLKLWNLSLIDKYYCTWKGNNSVKIVNQCLYWEREKKCYCLRCQHSNQVFLHIHLRSEKSVPNPSILVSNHSCFFAEISLRIHCIIRALSHLQEIMN